MCVAITDESSASPLKRSLFSKVISVYYENQEKLLRTLMDVLNADVGCAVLVTAVLECSMKVSRMY
jgi:hypothetical protein